MAKSKKRVASQAAESTTAFNPIVGLQRSDLVKSFGTFLVKAASNPKSFGSHVVTYSKDLIEIAKGQSDYAPDPKDRRFKDDVWLKNPFTSGSAVMAGFPYGPERLA